MRLVQGSSPPPSASSNRFRGIPIPAILTARVSMTEVIWTRNARGELMTAETCGATSSLKGAIHEQTRGCRFPDYTRQRLSTGTGGLCPGGRAATRGQRSDHLFRQRCGATDAADSHLHPGPIEAPGCHSGRTRRHGYGPDREGGRRAPELPGQSSIPT